MALRMMLLKRKECGPLGKPVLPVFNIFLCGILGFCVIDVPCFLFLFHKFIGRGGNRRSSLPPSFDVPLSQDIRTAVDLFRRQYDTYTDPNLQIAAINNVFDTFFSSNSDESSCFPRPHKLRSILGGFLARGEYDLSVIVLKSLRQRCLKAIQHLQENPESQNINFSSQNNNNIRLIASEFNDLILETQAASLRLAQCRLPIPLIHLQPP